MDASFIVGTDITCNHGDSVCSFDTRSPRGTRRMASPSVSPWNWRLGVGFSRVQHAGSGSWPATSSTHCADNRNIDTRMHMESGDTITNSMERLTQRCIPAACNYWTRRQSSKFIRGMVSILILLTKLYLAL